MPFNGSGGFTIINTFVPGTTILSSAVNQNYSDIATAGLSNCLTKDGQQTWGANQKAGGFGITGMAAAGASGQAVEYAQWQTSALLVGTIVDYGGGGVPAKWLACAGQAVSRTTYSLLFGAIGSIWGDGDHVSTFNIPDLRGRVLAGLDNLGGTPAGRIPITGLVTDSGTIFGGNIGSSGGSSTHVQTGVELANHIHAGSGNVSDPGHVHTSTVVVGGGGGAQAEFGAQDGGGISSNTATTNSNTTGITVPSLNIAASGGSGAMAWLQPTSMCNKIIFAGV